MTRLRKILFGLFGAYLLMAYPLAHADSADPGGASPKWHPGQRIQEIYSQLNLTDDQKKLLEANKQQHRAIMTRARQEMKTAREAFQEAMMKPQLDMPEINKLHNQIKILLSQMEDNKLSSILAVRAILTPDQFTKFVDLMRRHKQEHNE